MLVFKNPEKTSCIDLIITNRPRCFQTLETGLSDFHKITLTVMKVFCKKQKPTIITYRSYKHFSNEVFMANVQNSISANVQNRISQVTSENNDLESDLFKPALNKAIQKHAPIKHRYVRANQAPFKNKTINKEIMKRSQLTNKETQKVTLIGRRIINNVIFV